MFKGIKPTTVAGLLLFGAASGVLAVPPAAPASTRVAPVGSTGQVVAWTDSSADETGFTVERLDGSSWTQVGTFSGNSTSCVLQSQPPGVQSYRVIATNGDGPSVPGPLASTLRMNVLFLLIDDLGCKDIVSLRDPVTDGPTIYETPALDTLVSQGVRFTKAECSGPKCVVARRSIQSGMHDFRPEAVALGGGIGPEIHTIGEALHSNGYRTCYIGKWHLGGKVEGSTTGGEEDTSVGGLFPHTPPVYVTTTPEEQKVPSAQGYDVSIAAGEWGAPPVSYLPIAETGTGAVPGEYWYALPDLYTTNPNEYLTDRLTNEAIGFMNDSLANHTSQPFFLMLSHYAVHTPLVGKPELVTYFENKKAAMAAQLAAHPSASLPFETDFTSVVRNVQDQPIYAAMMKSMDESVANLRAYLSVTNDPRNPGLKLADTTLIIITGDNGGKSTHWIGSAPDNVGIPTSNYPLRQGKTWCYEGGLRIPLVVYWPGFSPANSACDGFVNDSDFYNTFLDMTGSPRVDQSTYSYANYLANDSISFATSVLFPQSTSRDEQVHWFTNSDIGTGNPAQGTYRKGDYKLVYHINRRVSELYNLRLDPRERNDVSSIRPDLTHEMQARLIALRDGLGAKPLPPTSNSWSTELGVLAPAMTIPALPNAAPASLTGTTVSDTAIDLNWSDASTNEQRFVIQRKTTGSGAYLEIATVPANIHRYRDTGLTPGTTYQYRIQSETLAGWYLDASVPPVNIPSNAVTVGTASSNPLPVIARGDDITTLVNEPRDFLPLINDQGKNLTITAISQPQPALGSASVSGGVIHFVPAGSATGECMMTYTVTDAIGASSTGTAVITILADHTVAPALTYDMSPTKTMVDDWEFNDVANTTIANCANSANASLKFASGTTPKTDGTGALGIVSSGGVGNTFRVTNAVSPGTKTLGASNAGIYELTMRFSAANLSGGDTDGAYASFAFRDTITTTTPEIFGIRLQKTAANELQLQYRNAGSAILATIAANTLSGPVDVRAEADMSAKTVTVYYNTGSGEVKKGTYAMHTDGVYWNTYRLSASNNSTDFGASDFIKIDYVRVKSLVYPAPPTAFQMWMDTAQGSTSPSPDKAALADADGDGVKNIVEYAFGSHPYQHDTINQFPLLRDTAADADHNNELILTIPIFPGTDFTPVGGILTGTGAGLAYSVQGTLDLSNFNQAPEEVYPALESGLPPAPRGWEYRSFRLPASNNAPRGFMRAGVEAQP